MTSTPDLSPVSETAAAHRHSLRRNILFNLVGALLPLGVSLIVIPVYLGRVGQSRYGIISLVWLLFGYFGLFDFGLSRATSNLLARPKNQDSSRQREVFWTATAINSLLGIAGALIFGFFGSLILSASLSVQTDLQPELRAAIPWVACLLPLSTTGAVFVGALEAHERFFELNAIQVIGSILGQVAPLAAIVLFGARVDVAVAATTLMRFLTTIPIFFLAVRQCGGAEFPRIERSTAKELFRYGGWVSVTNIVGPILVSVDQFTIGAMIGVGAVPRYAIPFNLATKILLLPAAMTRALFPQLTKMDMAAARERAASMTITVSLALAVICTPLIIISHCALTAWLGTEFSSQASILSRILICGVWANGVAYVPSTLLHSQGQPAITAKLHIYELLPFLILLWLGLHFFGLVGAALAWSIRVVVDGIFLFSAAGFYKRAMTSLYPALFFIASGFGVSVLTQASPYAAVAAAIVMFFVSLLYAISFDANFAKLFSRWPRPRLRG